MGRIIEELPFNTELRIKLEISYKMEMWKLQFSKIKLVMIVICYSLFSVWTLTHKDDNLVSFKN